MLVSCMQGRNMPAALALEPENETESHLCNLFVQAVKSGELKLRFLDTVVATDLDDEECDAIGS